MTIQRAGVTMPGRGAGGCMFDLWEIFAALTDKERQRVIRYASSLSETTSAPRQMRAPAHDLRGKADQSEAKASACLDRSDLL